MGFSIRLNRKTAATAMLLVLLATWFGWKGLRSPVEPNRARAPEERQEEPAPEEEAEEEATALTEADRLLRAAHPFRSKTEFDMQGEIRGARHKVPIALFVRPASVQLQVYRPREDRWSATELRIAGGRATMRPIGEDPSERGQEGAWNVLPEDLLMPWMFSTGARIEGEDQVLGVKTWKIGVTPPEGTSDYHELEIWLHLREKVLVQVDGRNKTGDLLKRLRVHQIRKRKDGRYGIHRIRVDGFDPASPGRIRSLSYIELNEIPASSDPSPPQNSDMLPVDLHRP